MNKNTFLTTLRASLKGLPQEEIDDIINDYEEHFAAGKKKKRTEANIAKALGNPKDLAKQHKASHRIKKAEQTGSASNIIRAVSASIGLGFFNLIIVLGPFVAIASVIIALFATGIAIAASGIALMLASIVSPFITIITMPINSSLGLLFVGIGLLALGILFIIGTWQLGKLFGKLTVSYLKLNASIITCKKEKEETP